MDRFAKKAAYVVLATIAGLAMIWFVTGANFSMALWGAPIVLSAEFMFLGLLYLNLFLDGHEEEEAHEEEARHTRPVNWHAQPQPA